MQSVDWLFFTSAALGRMGILTKSGAGSCPAPLWAEVIS